MYEIPAEEHGWGATSAYLIHGWAGHHVHQVKLMTTAAMMMVLKQKSKTSVSHLESALYGSAPSAFSPTSCWV